MALRRQPVRPAAAGWQGQRSPSVSADQHALEGLLCINRPQVQPRRAVYYPARVLSTTQLPFCALLAVQETKNLHVNTSHPDASDRAAAGQAVFMSCKSSISRRWMHAWMDGLKLGGRQTKGD